MEDHYETFDGIVDNQILKPNFLTSVSRFCGVRLPVSCPTFCYLLEYLFLFLN